MQDDWRIRNQRTYLTNQTFSKTIFSSVPCWDHEHCQFCFQRFVDGDFAFSCCDDKYWVCEKCFSDFKEEFGWKLQK